MIALRIFGIIMAFIISSCSFSQDQVLYDIAIDYINQDISKEQWLSFNIECYNRTAKTDDIKLRVSDEIINNDYGKVLCEIIRAEYKVTSCAKEFGTDSELLKSVVDSLERALFLRKTLMVI